MKTMFQTRLGLLLGVAALGAFPAAAGGAERLSLPTSRAYFPALFSTPEPAPAFSGGVMLNWRRNTYSADSRDNLFVRDRQGKLVASYRLFASGASQMKIVDVAASGDGSVAAVGQALSNEGRYSGYLAILSLDTSNARIVQLAPFEGRTITYGPDGTLWVLGWQLGADQEVEQRSVSTAPPHSVLHHYTGEGVLISQHLPWPEMECGHHPAGGIPALTASADRIGVLLPECSTWLELAPDGELLGRWQWQAALGYDDVSAQVHLTPPVMTPGNSVYCQIFTSVLIDRVRTRVLDRLYTLNRDRSTWEPVDTSIATAPAGKLASLYGIDGESLVFHAIGNEVVWVNVLKE